ncbi:hypothetical protein B0T22DRAFT_207970 [Podospora appendiculata]|uniref:Uncharacterized protein n=1 Tax=Podospora appendiculata TaxID=314037 RepID=A0AAE0X543_9PEZI|nr:hypothetical protein B0T22DRAFT_207970 [Podospora appendiculata]
MSWLRISLWCPWSHSRRYVHLQRGIASSAQDSAAPEVSDRTSMWQKESPKSIFLSIGRRALSRPNPVSWLLRWETRGHSGWSPEGWHFVERCVEWYDGDWRAGEAGSPVVVVLAEADQTARALWETASWGKPHIFSTCWTREGKQDVWVCTACGLTRQRRPYVSGNDHEMREIGSKLTESWFWVLGPIRISSHDRKGGECDTVGKAWKSPQLGPTRSFATSTLIGCGFTRSQSQNRRVE